jgi:hypothetical protein
MLSKVHAVGFGKDCYVHVVVDDKEDITLSTRSAQSSGKRQDVALISFVSKLHNLSSCLNDLLDDP